MKPDRSAIWIITGPRQVGKTRFCGFLIDQAQLQGFKLAGVICPPEFSEVEKTGITIKDLTTHEVKSLAVVRSSENRGLFTDHWVFDEEVMEWANQVLANTASCDLLLVDELGPLEFDRGQGWQNGLAALDQGKYKIAVVVIRPTLVEKALLRWPNALVIEIPGGLDDEAMKNLINRILQNNPA